MTNLAITSEEHSSEQMRASSRTARVLVRLIALYQRLREGRVAPCRFYPSCSRYALEALERHGAVKGSWLAVRRVLRCRPFGPHGIDLVPEPSATRSTHSCTR
jgi:uncharacterized protein